MVSIKTIIKYCRLFLYVLFLKRKIKKNKKISGVVMRNAGYKKYVKSNNTVPKKRHQKFFLSDKISNHKPYIKTTVAKAPSAPIRENVICHGIIAAKKLAKKLVVLSLKIASARKKTGKIISDDEKAIKKRAPNRVGPNKNVPAPEIYIGKTGGYSPCLLKYRSGHRSVEKHGKQSIEVRVPTQVI